MAKVLTYDFPNNKLKLKIRQLQVMGKEIQGKLITQAMNEISLNSQDKIEHFSSSYCLSAALVIECLTHFTNLQRSKRKRLKSNKRQKEQRKKQVFRV